MVIANRAASKWGAAAKFDFDNPRKWFTDERPVLDTHHMTDEKGRVIATVDKAELEKIAANNNQRIRETGDPAPLIVGHTRNDGPEKPVVGYAVNFHVKPFRRDPNTGQVIDYAIHVQRKFRWKDRDIPERYPRTSVELWWNKREIDPIAMLGGTTPERDLGIAIRHNRQARLELFAGNEQPAAVWKYNRRGNPVYRYEMEGDSMPGMNGRCAPGKKKYAEGEDPNAEGPGADPMVQKILESKPIKDMLSKVDEMYNMMQGGGDDEGGDMGGGGGDDGMGGGGDMGGGGRPPMEEERRMHGEEPVQFEEGGEMDDGLDDARPRTYMGGSGYPGSMDVHIPDTEGRRTRQYGRTREERTVASPDVIRLQRENADLKKRLHRTERLATGSDATLRRYQAREIIDSLKNEGISFGETPEEARGAEDTHVEMMMHMDDAAKECQVDLIRKHYQRAELDPASPIIPGTARYARNPTPEGDGDGDYEPQTPAEAVALANLECGTDFQVGPKKLSREEAMKEVKKRFQRRRA